LSCLPTELGLLRFVDREWQSCHPVTTHILQWTSSHQWSSVLHQTLLHLLAQYSWEGSSCTDVEVT